MTPQEFFQSKRFKYILIGLGSAVVLLLVFQAGVSVGFHKAGFSYEWGDNYHKMFGGPRIGIVRNFEGRDFISGHGTAGSIVRVDGDNLIIKGQDNVEKIAVVGEDTSIRRGNADLKVSDLQADEAVVVIGSPNNDGSINAKIIRVFDANGLPPPPGNVMFFNQPIYK